MSGVRKDRQIREAGDWKTVPPGTTITVRDFKELHVHGFLDVQDNAFVDLRPNAWVSTL